MLGLKSWPYGKVHGNSPSFSFSNFFIRLQGVQRVFQSFLLELAEAEPSLPSLVFAVFSVEVTVRTVVRLSQKLGLYCSKIIVY